MKTVTLEPELEEAAALLNPYQRRELARKLDRWSHQLRVSAAVLLSNNSPKPRPSLRALGRRRLVLN